MTDNAYRIKIVGITFMMLGAAIVLRLGYLQIIRYEHFSVLASETHLRKFEVAPRRGLIYMQDRGEVVPVAMNRNLKVLYADTRYINDIDTTERKLRSILGKGYRKELESGQDYIVLDREIELELAQKIDEAELSGIGLNDNYIRTYPEGMLAAQVMGFVNSDGEGQYGIEGYLDKELKGVPGLFNAETDTRGIPIATSDNIQVEAVEGDDVVLTIDRNIQAQAERVIKDKVEETQAESGYALIMEANSGRVLAMVNYPGFDPNEYSTVEDYSRFINTTTSSHFEPGSGFKVFTMAAGLDSGSITPEETYYDAGSVRVADRTIKNAEGGNRTISMTDIITYSVNTGVVYILEQLGGGEINEKSKKTLHRYFTGRFRLDESTGIEQPGEPELHMNSPDESGIVNYANMTFGQGVTTTMMRMVASMGAVINDGKLYRPTLIDHTVSSEGKVTRREPELIDGGMVSSRTSLQIREMMETVVTDGGGFGTKIAGYRIGGKTGTAQIPHPDGGYYDDKDIGTFTGFAPVENPRYVMMVRIDDPNIYGYAGSAAAGPAFGEIMEWLLRYEGVAPSEN